MNSPIKPEHQFKGAFAEDYAFLQLICPAVTECAARSAQTLSKLPRKPDGAKFQGLEIGCGSGLSTRVFLDARADLILDAIDLAPTMLDQAHDNLSSDINSGRLTLYLTDALSYLENTPSDSLDLVISNYAIHNFLDGYRSKVIEEIFRVMKPGAFFINGDRYGMDDPENHLRALQDEVRGYFRVFKEMNRWDLLEDWVIHVLSDESLDHVMRLSPSLEWMKTCGFIDIEILHRETVNTNLIASKAPT
jgi:ubiquinone/menaquinone biosynthesis C-methylase UbiE